MQTFKQFLLFIAISIFSTNFINAQVSFTHDYGSACAPTIVNFTNTSTLPPGTSYEWDISGMPTQYSVNASATFIYGGSIEIRLYAYDTTGGGNIELGRMEIELGILGSPQDFNISPYDKKACIGDELTFEFTEGIATNFSWDFGDGSPFENTQIVSHAYSSLGQKIVRLNFNSPCGADFLIDTVTIVNNNPINFSWIDVDDTACPNESVSLNVSATGVSNYDWVLGDGNTSASRVVTHSYSTLGQKNVSVKLSNSCPANPDTIILDIIQILGNLPFKGTLEAYANPINACPGDLIDFIAFQDFEDNGNLQSYSWNFGDGTTADGAIPTHTYSTTGIKPVTVIGANGCGNQTISSIIVNVQNNAVPTLDKEIDGPESFFGVFRGFEDEPYYTNACIGDTLSFLTYGHQSNLRWDFGDGNSSSQVSYVTVDLFGSFSYPLTFTKYAYSSNGNYSPKLTLYNSCGNSDTVSITVNIGSNNAANASFMLLPPSDGSSIEFTPCKELTYKSFGGQSYFWDFGDGTTINTNKSVVKHTYSTAGNYTITMEATNGCGFKSSMTTEVFIVSNSSPNADFNADITSGVAPLTVNFTNTSTNGSNYVWDFGDGVINSSGITNPSHTYNTPGIYTVQLTITNSCGASDNKTKLNYITANTISIGGTVFIDTITDTAILGKVFLFRKKANGLFDSLGSASINSNGYYQFNAAIAGQYYVLAKVNPTLYPNALPTYFIDDTKWYNADKITVNQNKLDNNIFVQSLPSSIPTGTGRIYGNIIQGSSSGKTGKVQGPGDPFNGIDVSLIDKSTGSSVAQQTSGENSGNDGGFDFTNVTNDTFGVYVDVTGVPTDAGFEIPINASNQSVYIAIIVDSNLISYNTTSIKNVKQSNNVDYFVVYPNPYRDFANIIYTLKETTNVKLEVFNILGERVSVLNSNKQSAGTYRYVFSSKSQGLSEGMYIIRLESDGNVITQKVLEIN